MAIFKYFVILLLAIGILFTAEARLFQPQNFRELTERSEDMKEGDTKEISVASNSTDPLDPIWHDPGHNKKNPWLRVLRNINKSRCFEDKERSISDLKMDWLAALWNQSFLSFLDFLDSCNFCSCIRVFPFFDINKRITYQIFFYIFQFSYLFIQLSYLLLSSR